jgi:hypothetical protein
VASDCGSAQRLASPERIENWSLMIFQQQPVNPARYSRFLLEERDLMNRLFDSMFRRLAEAMGAAKVIRSKRQGMGV